MPTGSLQRLAMSYDEWLRLPNKPKAEWVDGVAVVSPHAPFAHQDVVVRVAFLLRSELPALATAPEVPIGLPANRIRIPDVAAFPTRPTGFPATVQPVLVVEVLSPSTRREDLLAKAPEYAAAGIQQYWVVDPEARNLTVYRAASDDERGDWTTLLDLTVEQPTGTVEVGEYGTVDVDLREILVD